MALNFIEFLFYPVIIILPLFLSVFMIFVMYLIYKFMKGDL